MNCKLLCVLGAIFLVSVIPHIGSVRSGISGNTLEIHTNLRNIGTKDLDNGRVSVWIPELDIRTSRGVDIPRQDHIGKFIQEQVYDYKPGTYWARISLSGNNKQDSKFVLVDVY